MYPYLPIYSFMALSNKKICLEKRLYPNSLNMY